MGQSSERPGPEQRQSLGIEEGHQACIGDFVFSIDFSWVFDVFEDPEKNTIAVTCTCCT